MRRTTIFADEQLLNELRELARQERKSVAELIRDALEQYIRSKQKSPRRLSIIGIGKSGRSDIAEKHEEFLWQESSE